MKSRFCLLVVLLGCAVLAPVMRAADADIAFVGVMKEGKGLKMALKNSKSGSSAWLNIGQSFEGYTLKHFDELAGVLVLTKGSEELRLTLKSAQVRAGSNEISPEVRRAILNNLRQFASAADQFYLEHGVRTTTYDDLVGPTKYIRRVVVVDGEDYRALRFEQGKPLEVRTAGGAVVSYAN